MARAIPLAKEKGGLDPAPDYSNLIMTPERDLMVANFPSIIVSGGPVCSNSVVQQRLSLPLHQRSKLRCAYSISPMASSLALEFRWYLNSSNGEIIDYPRSQFESKANTSVLTLSTASSLDYGAVYCEARGPLGPTTRPCVFNIAPLGKACFLISLR